MAKKGSPSWSHVKKKIGSFDRIGLIGLVKDLFEFSEENRAFLLARFADEGDSRAAIGRLSPSNHRGSLLKTPMRPNILGSLVPIETRYCIAYEF